MVSGVSGGDKLETILAGIAAKTQGSPVVRVGFLEGKTYPDGTSVAMVAAIQEYGAPSRGIPPRSFFRVLIAARKTEWGKIAAKLLVDNKYDVEKTLTMMGDGIKSQLQQQIIDTNSPALSEVTRMLRMMRVEDPDLKITGAIVGVAAARVAAGEIATDINEKALIDTGFMYNSVDREVKMS